MDASELHLIAPVSAVRKRPRLAKMVPVFLALGKNVRLHGWERIRGECREFAWPDDRVSEAPILRGGGYVSKRARAMYPLWMLVVFLRVLTLGRRKLLFCLGWETAFPALVAAKLTRSTVIFDDADRFSMVLRLPAPAHKVLVALEYWASRHAQAHLVPGWTRYSFRHPGMKLLRNTPTTADFEHARQTASTRPDAELVLYVNGWIGQTRGAPIFLELMRRLAQRQRRIVMIAAGWTDCDAGHALFKQPNVHFYGELPTDAALALYHASDVVLTYYDPEVPINRHAESNKWGDCIFLGKPFIVNSEVETARTLVEDGYGYLIAYRDVDGLLAMVEGLAEHRGTDLDMQVERSGTEVANGYQPFDIAIRQIFAEMGGSDDRH